MKVLVLLADHQRRSGALSFLSFILPSLATKIRLWDKKRLTPLYTLNYLFLKKILYSPLFPAAADPGVLLLGSIFHPAKSLTAGISTLSPCLWNFLPGPGEPGRAGKTPWELLAGISLSLGALKAEFRNPGVLFRQTTHTSKPPGPSLNISTFPDLLWATWSCFSVYFALVPLKYSFFSPSNFLLPARPTSLFPGIFYLFIWGIQIFFF